VCIIILSSVFFIVHFSLLCVDVGLSNVFVNLTSYVSFFQPSKYKGHEVTAVGWNFGNDSDVTTGPILLGTSKGLIFETQIAQDGEGIFQSSLEQYWRQVCGCLCISWTTCNIQ
jgi:hypothetical protein